MSFRSHPGCIEYTVQCVESRRVAPLLTKSHYTIFVAQRGFYKRPNMHSLELWNVRLEAHDCSMVLSKLRWHSTTTTFWRPFWSSTFSKSEFRTDFLVVVLMINLCFVDFVCHLYFMIRFDGQRAVYTWKNIFVMQKPCVIDISRTVDTVTYSVFLSKSIWAKSYGLRISRIMHHFGRFLTQKDLRATLPRGSNLVCYFPG